MGPVVECPHCFALNPAQLPSRSEGVQQDSQPTVGKSTSTPFVIDDEDLAPQTETAAASLTEPARTKPVKPVAFRGKALAAQAKAEHLAKANNAVNLRVSHAGGFLRPTNKLAQSAAQAKDDRLKQESTHGVGVLVTVVVSCERVILTTKGEFYEHDVLSKEQVG